MNALLSMDLNALMKDVVSPLLGYGIMAGAVFLQVPQIVACYRAKSVQGLSATSIYASLLAPMTYTIYSIRQGNEWHTWAENVVLVAQNMVLIVMVWMYSTPKVPHSTKSMVCSFIVGLAVMSYSVPDSHQYLLPLMNIPFLLSSRIPQIMENFKNGSTGTLSPIPLSLVVLGALARIFTTIQSIGMKWSIISTYMTSSSLALITVVQIFYYKDSSGGSGGAGTPAKAAVASRTRSAKKKKQN
jgi:mannose-P-dolichol utilization defect protein 1